ncbi:MAG: TIGR04255 family protein [Candidatus Cloacimonetes bacterium]|nr:TIGR04255 family protein [Candidatus Cloacimonadota bacterium]
MEKLPKRLKSAPLVEVIWQVKFENSESIALGDLLPGILYSELRKEHKDLKLWRLPTADIPPQVAQNTRHLRDMVKFRLEGSGIPFLFQVGDNTLTLNCRKPYVGWKKFREKILQLIELLEKSGLVQNPAQHSLRYIDLLQINPAPDLSSLQIKVHVGQLDTSFRPLQMRIELPEPDCLHVIQVATPANAQLPEGTISGSVVDLETMPGSPPTSWSNLIDQLDLIHERSLSLFFNHILTRETLAKLEPEF